MTEREYPSAVGATSAPVDFDVVIAQRAIEAYGFTDATKLSVLNISENATYLVGEEPGGRQAILRVHRHGYHSRAAIESELAWLAALRGDTDIRVAEAIPNENGDLVTAVHFDGAERYAVLFHLVPGVEPDGARLGVDDFEALGAMTARMHLHSRSWTRPEAFSRFYWDWEHSLGDQPRWGRWQDGFGVGDIELDVFGRAADLVRRRLEVYGTAPDRFGLVHADLRLANLLVDDDTITVIDFDDSGFSWFMYDFGSAVSFIEHDPRLPEWREAWLRGYRSVAPLGSEHEAMLPTFVMLRRLLLIAWMGTHSHSQECQTLGPGYTKDTVALAQRYIGSDGTEI